MSSSTQPSPIPNKTETTQSQSGRATAIILGLAPRPLAVMLHGLSN